MLGLMLTSRLGDNAQTTVSYSAFKQQIRQGNVKEVTIKGLDISGRFTSPYSPADREQESGGRTFTAFTTTKPAIEDPGLIELLEENDVQVNAETTSAPVFQRVLILLAPWILFFALILWANKRMAGQMKGMMGRGLFGVGKSKARRFEKTTTSTSFDDVAGLENAKRDLQEIVEYLKEPKKFTGLGASIPKGVLLMGPPGTGKTLLARASAGEAGVPFFSVSGSEFIEMFVGVGASRVRNMFEDAKKSAPTIIFVDEIDSVGRTRGAGLGGGHDEREQTLNQILQEMDGFEPHESVVVIAATNRPDVLDPALTRPGRFDRQIVLELPQKNARREILRIHTRNVPVANDVDLDNIAARSVGFSGADLRNLVNEAALLAGRRDKKTVDARDFDNAADKILLGAEREERIDDDEKRIIAYHEAGHALVAKLLPETDPLQKVTIIPRGRALGVTQQVPETDRHNYSRKYLLGRITMALGGRASEKLVFSELTNGAANDFKMITQLARRMVCQWGMSDKIGPVTFSQGEEHIFLGRELTQAKDFSEHTGRIIDDEIQRIVREMEQRAENLLKENRDKLDKIAEALLEQETLENDEVDRIIGNRARKQAGEA
ncbi:MAG: ATP-dependent zinc metalloprotease FtsH [Chitinivibrionales bacterium]|nr:ATP-dependent zinc metalloprotease FtsH [Chitinivibrionales bacterium]MBD3395307.1 ATP-dependent zinc metalloprotease FtsH [Chitinivibrionales bacterium]